MGDVPKRPFAAIVGGSKVSSKISVIEAMLNKVDKLILGGGMVFTFLKARGVPVGSSLVEKEPFSKGTFGVAEALAELTSRGCTTIIGGGDSAAAVEQVGLGPRMSHISTGGGASLELLEGKVLPGVDALDDA